MEDCQGERIKKKMCEKRLELVISEGKKVFYKYIKTNKEKAKLWYFYEKGMQKP